MQVLKNKAYPPFPLGFMRLRLRRKQAQQVSGCLGTKGEVGQQLLLRTHRKTKFAKVKKDNFERPKFTLWAQWLHWQSRPSPTGQSRGREEQDLRIAMVNLEPLVINYSHTNTNMHLNREFSLCLELIMQLNRLHTSN